MADIVFQHDLSVEEAYDKALKMIKTLAEGHDHKIEEKEKPKSIYMRIDLSSLHFGEIRGEIKFYGKKLYVSLFCGWLKKIPAKKYLMGKLEETFVKPIPKKIES